MSDSNKDNEHDIENVLNQFSDQDIIRNLLFESLKREKELKRLLNEQVIINDKLKIELEIEKRKTSIKGKFGILKKFSKNTNNFKFSHS